MPFTPLQLGSTPVATTPRISPPLAAPKKKGILTRVTDAFNNNPLKKVGQQIGHDISESFDRRVINEKAILGQVVEREKSPVAGGIGLAREGTGFVKDAIGAVLNPLVKPTVKALYNASAQVRNLAEKGNFDDLKKRDLEAAAVAMETSSTAWKKFQAAHPNFADIIGLGANIGEIATTFAGGGAAKKSVETGVKDAATLAEEAASVTKKSLKSAIPEAPDLAGAVSQVRGAVNPVLGSAKETLGTAGEMLGRGLKATRNAMVEKSRISKLHPIERGAYRAGFSRELVERVAQAPDDLKARFGEMIDKVETRLIKDPNSPDRAVEVVGDALIQPAVKLSKKLKDVGKALGESKKGLRDVPVDISPIKEKLAADMDAYRIAVSDAKEGDLLSDGAELVGMKGKPVDEDVLEVLNDVYKFIGKKEELDDAEVLTLLREAFYKETSKKNVPFSPNATRVMREYRDALLQQMDTINPAIGELSHQYAEIKDALKTFTDWIGFKKGSLENLSEKSLSAGEKSRRLLGQAEAKPREVIDQLRAALEANGIPIEDIDPLIRFADELDDLFGPTQTTSFQGSAQRAVEGAMKNVTGPVSAVTEAGKGLLRMGQPGAVEKLEALKNLIKRKK